MAFEQIHSGHFMTSNPHTDAVADDDDEDIEVDVVEDDEKPEDNSNGSNGNNKALNVQDEKPVTFYKFGPKKTQSIAIDVSLNKLNKCIKVAYNKMTTPKWKDFKGLKLHWKQRIRLNNVIWRAYYLEFRKKTAPKQKKKTPFCYFAVPDDDTTHQKIEGSLVEGMYWKRRMEAVCAQYKRWRIRGKQTIVHEKERGHKRKRNISLGCDVIQVRNDGEPPTKIQRSQTPKNMSSDFFDDDFENVFTDELFDLIKEPYIFPDRAEMFMSGNADIMQPGLHSLQPSLEEIMASLSDFPDPDPLTPRKISDVPSTSTSTPVPPRSPIPREVHTLNSSNSAMMGPPTVPRRVTPLLQSPIPQRPSQQDYAAASMLVDYSNQVAMPTRSASSITSQMLMLSSTPSQPQYSTATTYHALRAPALVAGQPWKPQVNIFSALPGSSSSSATGPLSGSSSDYMPQFLQSPSSSVVPSPNSMLLFCSANEAHPSIQMAPNRSWWLDSPLTASVQSPLSVSTPLSVAHQHGPSTPHGHLLPGAGPSTPPTIFRAMSSTSDIGDNRLDPSSLCAPQSVIGKMSLAHRLEQPSSIVIQNAAERKEEILPSLHKQPDWQNGGTAAVSRVRTTSLCSDGIAGSPTSAWKLPAIDPTALYQQTAAFTSNTSVSRQLQSNGGPRSAASATGRSPDLMTSLRSPANDQLVMTTPGGHKIEMKEEPMLMSAPSSVKPARGNRQVKEVQADSTLHPEERKRILHLHAEQNRRSALKDGFDQLMEMIPDLYSGGVKPTNAVVLAKAADHIRRLQSTKVSQQQLKEEAQARIDKLNQKITALQSNLPASAGPSTSQNIDSKMSLENFYDRFAKEEARKNWRFWVMCRMLQSICVGSNASFAANVAGENASREEVAATCSDWLQKHWRAAELRPLASTLLVHLATNTNVLTDPQSLKDYVADQLKNPL